MKIRDRILEVIEKSNKSKEEIEEITGINKHTWGNLKAGRQRANEEHIEAMISIWPEYAYWLTTGKTMPECGQISPELEEIREKQNLKTGTE